ncbi:MAG: helix-turn-helix domain-containing protein [Oscillospiraceae bacterium]|nr:helix-turn-helix domain-containing protein [Oscillospiraceae bacterium]
MDNINKNYNIETENNNESTNYISVDEVAKTLSIARATAYQLTKTEGFPCFHIGKRIIIPSSSLHKWAEEQANMQATLLG